MQLAVGALLAALHAYPESEGVQHQGCNGLGILCRTSAEARELSGSSGAVEAVATALRVHAGDADVLDAVCTALGYLMIECPENCGRAHRAGVSIDSFLDVMRTHPLNERVQHAGCTALAIFCSDFRAPAESQLRALACIVNALRSFPDDYALQSNACAALAAVLPLPAG